MKLKAKNKNKTKQNQTKMKTGKCLRDVLSVEPLELEDWIRLETTRSTNL